jgi:hypothetical protein
MPDNRSLLLCASGVAVLAALAHLAKPGCPHPPPTTPDRVIADADWGTVVNLDAGATQAGTLFAATETTGRHRVLRSMQVAAPGRYRISVDTRYAGTTHMAIEAGGPQQPYGLVTINVKNGTIEKIEHDVLDAGVEAPIGQTGVYRWWVDMALNPGEFDYDFSILSAYRQHDFPGTGICKVALSNPSLHSVGGAQKP